MFAGIEPVGNRVMRPAIFTVDTFSAGQGQVTIYIEDPEGTKEEVSSANSCLFTQPHIIILLQFLSCRSVELDPFLQNIEMIFPVGLW